MAMAKSAVEWMVFILLFLSIVLGLLEKVEVEAAVLEVSVSASTNLTMNFDDWNNAVLQSNYRAHALMSRLHAAGSNSSSTAYMHQLSSNAAPVVSGNSDGTTYIVNVGFGTPPKQNIKMKFDTASDVSWLSCDYSGGSSTHKRLDCKSCDRQAEGVSCNTQNQCILEARYADGKQIMAHMSEDTLWVGSQSFPDFAFGCGYNFKGFEDSTNRPSIGSLAFGRNSLSLPSQARRLFTYCVPDFMNPKQKGWLSLGDAASIPSASMFTALLSNPMATSWYFVQISGISVGGTRLNISPQIFQFNSGGSGGTILDSIVLMSQLVPPAYNALRAAFLNHTKEMKLTPRDMRPELPLDTCFTYTGDIAKLQIPAITFHFQDGLNLPINQKGIVSRLSDDVICLMFHPSVSNDLNIIGALQQQGYTISFDKDRKKIGFAPVTTCS